MNTLLKECLGRREGQFTQSWKFWHYTPQLIITSFQHVRRRNFLPDTQVKMLKSNPLNHDCLIILLSAEQITWELDHWVCELNSVNGSVGFLKESFFLTGSVQQTDVILKDSTPWSRHNISQGQDHERIISWISICALQTFVVWLHLVLGSSRYYKHILRY